MNPKQQAAEAAVSFVRDGMVVGLGTGSTAEYFLSALGRAVREGRVKGIVGVPTSVASEELARRSGIPLTTLVEHPVVDVTVDGADEVDPKLDLIKGLGGALLREKIVAQATRKMVVVVDAGKVVSKLGTKGPLPIEVAPFAHETHVAFLRTLGGEAVLRRRQDGSPYVTDNGNYIYHTRFAAIEDPAGLDAALKRRAGVVESGLFVGLAQVVLVGEDGGGVRQITRGG